MPDPAGTADPDHDWGRTSCGTSQARQVPAPRGNVLGGSSAVNAAVAGPVELVAVRSGGVVDVVLGHVGGMPGDSAVVSVVV